MKTIKGPAVFLSQFMDDKEPFNSLDGLCKWASHLDYKGIQIPTDTSLIDLEKAAASQTYCDEFKEKINSYGLEITELSTHLQGQLVAVHPAYDIMFDNFCYYSYTISCNPRCDSWLKRIFVISRYNYYYSLFTIISQLPRWNVNAQIIISH